MSNRALAFAALLFLGVGAMSVLRPDDAPEAATAADGGVELCADGYPCEEPTAPFTVVPSEPPGPRLQADDVCRRSGYLCAALDQWDRVDIRRWKDFDGTIVVHVPAPDFERPADARELQRAAAAGIRAWNGQPFPIVVDERGRRDAHFSVEWARSMMGNALGSAETSWHPDTGLQVLRLTLRTRFPYGDGVIPGRQLRLTAAHEMGHALGLPHSDEERDMMYPTNTATAPSAQDYRTLEALYGFEDGSVIVR